MTRPGPDRLLRDATEVAEVLRGNRTLVPVSLERTVSDALETASKSAAGAVGSATDATVDEQLAIAVHSAFAGIRASTPWLLNGALLWQWVALHPCRHYVLRRWCGGDEWIDDPVAPVPTGAARFILTSGSVKSHHRHAIRRLYIYADCSFSRDGTYDHINEILNADQDIPGAVFERKLGLAPLMSLVLVRTARGFVPTKRGPGVARAVSARTKRREFFKQVNFLASTVALEYLDEAALTAYFNEIAGDIG